MLCGDVTDVRMCVSDGGVRATGRGWLAGGCAHLLEPQLHRLLVLFPPLVVRHALWV